MSHNNFELLKEGNPLALENIHAKHSRHVFWIGKRLIRDTFVVESLVQDTFLKLWVHRDTIESPKHIFYFLRFVMTRECNTFYSRPKNKFFREINSLENFENYQDYMAGYDPLKESEGLQGQESEQKAFDQIKNVLPLISSERKHLIDLCLKYGFHYKAISEVMGTSITETSNEVKLAIKDLKTIIKDDSLINKKKPAGDMKAKGVMTVEQEKVLQLRCGKNYSFASIALELNISQKEVHKEFIAAYKLMQEKHHQEQQSA